MRIKKSGGKIFGADFTAAERKAMDKEISGSSQTIPRSTGWSWTR